MGWIESISKGVLFFYWGSEGMDMFTPEQWNEIRNISLCSGFASISGGLSYLVKVREGKKFSWAEFVLHLGVSAVAGIIAYQTLHYYEVPADLSGALCGISGWMGTRMMRIFEIFLVAKLGLGKAVLDQVTAEEKTAEADQQPQEESK